MFIITIINEGVILLDRKIECTARFFWAIKNQTFQVVEFLYIVYIIILLSSVCPNIANNIAQKFWIVSYYVLLVVHRSIW